MHNTKELRCGRVLSKFSVIIARLKDILNRFANVLRCIDVSTIADSRLDELPTASQVGHTRVGGVDVNKPRVRAVMEAVITLSAAPAGFSSSEVAAQVRTIYTPITDTYTARQAA